MGSSSKWRDDQPRVWSSNTGWTTTIAHPERSVELIFTYGSSLVLRAGHSHWQVNRVHAVQTLRAAVDSVVSTARQSRVVHRLGAMERTMLGGVEDLYRTSEEKFNLLMLAEQLYEIYTTHPRHTPWIGLHAAFPRENFAEVLSLLWYVEQPWEEWEDAAFLFDRPRTALAKVIYLKPRGELIEKFVPHVQLTFGARSDVFGPTSYMAKGLIAAVQAKDWAVAGAAYADYLQEEEDVRDDDQRLVLLRSGVNPQLWSYGDAQRV